MKNLKRFEDIEYSGNEPLSKEEQLRLNRKEGLERIMNPLNSKSKQSARNFMYKISIPIISGIHTDDYWTPVRELFKTWNKLKVDWDEYKPQQYFNMHEPFGSMDSPRKEWYITISFYNNRGVLNHLHGTLTAAFNGTREDPTKRYDLNLVL